MNQETIHELRTNQIEAYRNSGKTAQAWCDENQLNIHTLKYWIQKLNRQEKDKSAPQWVSLIQEPPASSSITIHIGVATIEVTSGFDSQLLRQVMGILKEIC
jgi:hypothetical protein